MPAIATLTLDTDVRIALWRPMESEEELLRLFPEGMQPTIPTQRTTPKRRVEFLTTHLLLTQLLGYLPTVHYAESGRPYLAAEEAELSISHTKGCVAVALHPTQRIGIDVEQWGEKAHCVRHKYMGAEELALIEGMDEQRATVVVWSAKEALFKAIACREVDFKKHLQLHNYSSLSSGCLSMQEHKTPHERHYRLHYIHYDHFVLTLAIVAL